MTAVPAAICLQSQEKAHISAQWASYKHFTFKIVSKLNGCSFTSPGLKVICEAEIVTRIGIKDAPEWAQVFPKCLYNEFF